MLSSKLMKIVGKENVSEDKHDKIIYDSDASVAKGKVKCVVWPKDAKEVNEIIKLCAKEKVDIVIRGGGSGLAGGSVPEDSLVLDMERMNNIKIKDDEVIVEAGVVLSELNYKLGLKEKYFPILPSSEKVCTIGGMIACNASGNRAIKYGRTCDWVEEIKIIDGDAQEKTLKGFDVQDFCRSEGILGVIVEAKLKITDMLKDTTMTMFSFDDKDEMIRKVEELNKDKSVVAIEYVGRVLAKMLKYKEKDHLLVEYESDEGKVSCYEEKCELWRMREGAYPVLATAGYKVIEDPKINLLDMPKLLEWCEKNKVPCFGHIGIGLLHPCFKDAQEKEIKEMMMLVKGLKGEVSGEHGIGMRKREYLLSKDKERLRILKNKYDKDNVFAKGKVI